MCLTFDGASEIWVITKGLAFAQRRFRRASSIPKYCLYNMYSQNGKLPYYISTHTGTPRGPKAAAGIYLSASR